MNSLIRAAISLLRGKQTSPRTPAPPSPAVADGPILQVRLWRHVRLSSWHLSRGGGRALPPGAHQCPRKPLGQHQHRRALVHAGTHARACRSTSWALATHRLCLSGEAPSRTLPPACGRPLRGSEGGTLSAPGRASLLQGPRVTSCPERSGLRNDHVSGASGARQRSSEKQLAERLAGNQRRL